ncbi:PAS domain-containing sensor histidine kinase [Labedella phragmitis]|uniref:histidine kinase n=1 Tax=Labedella phragmitis TaxID=2498849 RepID=A0A3S3ZBQ1_9MICO|nr:ATP-binding protein [Labedella phragmitis]RWZ53216.1 PAS domain-containing sensor histidine kinase [Labedella phragmitis]
MARVMARVGDAAAQRLERSVFRMQMLAATSVLALTVVTYLFSPVAVTDALYVTGLAIMFLATAVAAAVPWARVPHNTIALVPLLDIAAIMLVREGEPAVAASLFFVFPIFWLASHFSAWIALLGPAICSVLLWMSIWWRGETLTVSDVPTLFVLPITFMFLATAAFQAARRGAAHRVLLRQQSRLLEGAVAGVRRQQETLDEIINAVTFGVIGYDDRGNVVLVNQAHRALMEPFGDLNDALVQELVYLPDRVTPIPESRRPYRRAMRGEVFDNEIIWQGRPGERRIALAVSARQLLDEDGESQGCIIITRDVTPELAAVEARDDFVASVSHELRTPLTSVLGYLDLVVDSPGLDDESRRLVGIALDNSERLLQIVSDLLATVSGDSHRFVMHFAPCEITEIAAQSIEAARVAGGARGITLDVRSSGDVVVMGDAFRLRQVMDNFVSNAIKYNNDGGSVLVTVTDVGADVRVTVRDTGRGMRPDEQERLFERFYRTDSVRQTSIHGTGLGLNIAREIIEEHGGSVAVESEQGAGTTFTVTLPKERRTAAALAVRQGRDGHVS